MSINFPNLDGEVCDLRRAYATLTLLNDGIDIHRLARIMGKSLGIIDRHHSQLTLRMNKDALAGKRYGLTRAQYEASFGRCQRMTAINRTNLNNDGPIITDLK